MPSVVQAPTLGDHFRDDRQRDAMAMSNATDPLEGTHSSGMPRISHLLEIHRNVTPGTSQPLSPNRLKKRPERVEKALTEPGKQ